MDITIQPELSSQYTITEELIRNVFWNLYQPGCDEHIIARLIRQSIDYIPEYSLVAMDDQKNILGCILYTKSKIEYEVRDVPIATFGPVAVASDFQGKGIGSKLIRESINLIKQDELYHGVAILGYPHVYKKYGFQPSNKYNIAMPDGTLPKGLQILETKKGCLNGKKGKVHLSEVFSQVEDVDIEKLDATFPKKKKFETNSQKMFLFTMALSQHDEDLSHDQIAQSMDRNPIYTTG